MKDVQVFRFVLFLWASPTTPSVGLYVSPSGSKAFHARSCPGIDYTLFSILPLDWEPSEGRDGLIYSFIHSLIHLPFPRISTHLAQGVCIT